MKALQYRAIGRAPEVVNVPDPTVGPGEVLLRVTAAGACHSDAFIISRSAEQYVFGPLPLTLGHECAGVVAEVGVGVDQVAVGEAVLVYPPWGCGVCRNCARGKENYCLRPGGARPPGIAGPGAMAEYLLVDDQRHLVPRNSRPGGARGAHRRRANPRPRPQALPTLSLAGRMAAIEAEVSIVGVGEAALPVRVGSPAHDVAVRAPYWGSRAELLEVVEMAAGDSCTSRRRLIPSRTRRSRMSDSPRAVSVDGRSSCPTADRIRRHKRTGR